MDASPISPAAAAPNRVVELARPPAEEEIPLGWECANPALQIESWGLQEVPPSSKS